MNRSFYVAAFAAAFALTACEDKKQNESVPPTGSAAATPTVNDDAIPVAADFEADAESITPENVDAEVAKMEAELAKAD